MIQYGTVIPVSVKKTFLLREPLRLRSDSRPSPASGGGSCGAAGPGEGLVRGGTLPLRMLSCRGSSVASSDGMG